MMSSFIVVGLQNSLADRNVQTRLFSCRGILWHKVFSHFNDWLI